MSLISSLSKNNPNGWKTCVGSISSDCFQSYNTILFKCCDISQELIGWFVCHKYRELFKILYGYNINIQNHVYIHHQCIYVGHNVDNVCRSYVYMTSTWRFKTVVNICVIYHSTCTSRVLPSITSVCPVVNSLWPGDSIWRHGTRSTVAQVMACCLTAPSHYLNQCWLIISKVQWHSS